MSADNPAALLAVAVLVLVFGMIGIVSLPIQMLPNLEYPEINVGTSWRSAAPQEVEANIIKPQEDVLRGVPGVVEMSSNVRTGGGNVHLRFDVGTDLKQAMIDVLNALYQAPALPVDAGEPQIQVGGCDFPVATLLAAVEPRILGHRRGPANQPAQRARQDAGAHPARGRPAIVSSDVSWGRHLDSLCRNAGQPGET